MKTIQKHYNLQIIAHYNIPSTDTIENNSNTLHITVYKQNSVNC